MGLFKDILKDSESLFLNAVALDPEFMPKEIPYREQQQHYIAECIKPLFQGRSGKNLFITGKPGIGKTLAVKHIFRELEEETQEILPLYVNCWKKDTSFRIVSDICEQINFPWTHNKKTDELFKDIAKILNKKAVVLCLDECDKAKELDILYTFLEDVYKKNVIFITNESNWLTHIDARLRSRLHAERLEFKPYSLEETKGILKKRAEYALVPHVLEGNAFQMIVEKTFQAADIRTGLFLLRESGTIAENKSSKKILLAHVQEVLEKGSFVIKGSADFGVDKRDILHLVKEHSGKTMRELFDLYPEEKSYRTFQRKIQELRKNNIVSCETSEDGQSMKVSYLKKLEEY